MREIEGKEKIKVRRKVEEVIRGREGYEFKGKSS